MVIDDKDTLLEALEGRKIIGVDEVGRGSWAGPICAGAFVFNTNVQAVPGLRDSKKLSPARRHAIEPLLTTLGRYGYGEVSNSEIDQIGIEAANVLAMRRAIVNLDLPSLVDYHLVVDGNRPPALADLGAGGMSCLIKADDKVTEVSAAAVLAKVLRDRAMADASLKYPGYGFEKHFGYGSAQHQLALTNLGLCALHRTTFKPMKNMAPIRH